MIYALAMLIVAQILPGHRSPHASGAFTTSSSFIVATNGTDGGAGTLADPLSITKAIGGTSPATAGSTIYVRGGTYPGGLTSVLTGTSASRIFVMPYASEHPVIEATATNTTCLSVNGAHTQFAGFEVWNSATPRAPRNAGIIMRSPGSKLVNLVVHDTGVGIYVGEESVGAEVNGCLIYNYGDEVLPAKHAIYAHSVTNAPSLILKDNVTANGFYCGLHCYSEVAGELKGFAITGNTCFESGSLFGTSDRMQNFLIGGTVPMDEVTLLQNAGYFSSSFQDNLLMGYSTTDNGTAVVHSNYFGRGSTTFNSWTNLVVTKNTWHAISSYFNYNLPPSPGTIVWNTNDYSASFSPFQIGGGGLLSFSSWKAGTGFDANSTFSPAPSGTRVFVRGSDYAPRRGTIVVYNWDAMDNVLVDVSSLLSVGEMYAVRNAQDYFGPAALSGTYGGGSINLPMTNLTVAVPVGVSAPGGTGIEFNAFIVELGTDEGTRVADDGGTRLTDDGGTRTVVIL